MVLITYAPSINEKIHAINTALGFEKADLVIKNVNLVNVITEEIEENIDIAIKGRLIARIGKCDDLIGLNTQVIDGKDMYILPGFVDAHLHIESSFLTPLKFSKAVIPHGTTCVFIDPHEIGNVLGIEGIKEFVNECLKCPIKIFITIPSCIPATKFGFETCPNKLTPEDINILLNLENVIALGEVMDNFSILNADIEHLKSIQYTYSKFLRVCGHAPKLSGNQLQAYLIAGPDSDHENTDLNEVLEKLKRGMYVMIRYGTFSQDMPRIIKELPRKYLDSGYLMFVSDDLNIHELLKRGHMNFIVREAIRYGIDPIKAIKMCTLIPCRYYNLDWLIGSINPGKIADLIIIKKIENVDIQKVIINGKVVYSDGKLLIELPRHEYPKYFYYTVRYLKFPKPEDLKIKVNIELGFAKVNVIGIVPGSIITKHEIEELEVRNYEVIPSKNIAKIIVIERHGKSGTYSIGFIKGFPIKEGAIATSISHDSHNVTAVGYSEEDICIALKRLEEIGGGLVFVKDKEVKSEIKLSVAGLMSDKEPEEVCKEIEEFLKTWSKFGGIEDIKALAPLFLMSLVVIPEIRITDKGLVNVIEGKFIDVIVETRKS